MIKGKIRNFWNDESGDTNFIAIILIIAVVVVLAGIFLTFATGAMNKVSDQVTNFVDSAGSQGAGSGSQTQSSGATDGN